MTKISALPNEPILQNNHVIPIYDPNEYVPANQNKSITLADMATFFGVAPVYTGNIIYVDSLYGNDFTGAVDNPALPFQTIASAQSVASPGYKIIIRPGTYTDSNLGNHLVEYYFEAGAVLTSASNCFNDFGANSFNVTGSGVFYSGQAIVFTSGSGNIYFEGLYAEATGGGSRAIWSYGGGIIVVNIKTDLRLTGLEQVVRIDGEFSEVYIFANKIYGVGGIMQGGPYLTSKCFIYAKEIIYDAGSGGYVGYNNAFTYLEVHAKNTFIGNGVYGLAAIRNTATGDMKFYGDIDSTFTDGTIDVVGAGKIDIYGKVTGIGFIRNGVGILNLFDNVVMEAGSQDVIIHNGGKTIIHSLVYNKNLGAGSRCINVNSAGVILKQTASLWVNSILAESVFALGPQTIQTYPGAVANVAINVNITELVSTLLIDANIDNEN